MNVEMTIASVRSRRGLLLIGMGCVCFGFTGVTSKALYTRTDITPLGVSWLRILIGALALMALQAARAARLPRPRAWRDGLILLGLGLCMVGYQITFFSGVQHSTVTTVTLIANCMAPVVVALLAPLFLGGRIICSATCWVWARPFAAPASC